MRKSDYLNNNTEYFLNNKESQKSSEDLKSIKTYFFNNLVFIGSLMSQYRNTSSRKVILVIITIINYSGGNIHITKISILITTKIY